VNLTLMIFSSISMDTELHNKYSFLIRSLSIICGTCRRKINACLALKERYRLEHLGAGGNSKSQEILKM
jgi:hypothetical protein